MKQKNFEELLKRIQGNSYQKEELSIITRDDYYELREGYVYFDDQSCLVLVAALKNNKYITELNLNSNKLGDVAAKALATLSNLKKLNVSSNFFSVEGFAEIIKTPVELLNVSYVYILKNYQAGTKNLTEVFTYPNQSITELNLANCNLDGELVDIAINELIKNNKTIEILNLDSNYLGDGCLQFLSENSTLKKLFLDHNQLTDLATEYIAKNVSLTELSLAYNNITDAGVKNLSNHSNLKILSISNEGISNEGLKILEKMNLDVLDVRPPKYQNHFTPEELEELEAAFSSSYDNSEVDLIAEEATMVDEMMPF